MLSFKIFFSFLNDTSKYNYFAHGYAGKGGSTSMTEEPNSTEVRDHDISRSFLPNRSTRKAHEGMASSLVT